MLKEAFQRLGSVIKAFSDAARAAAIEARRGKGKARFDESSKEMPAHQLASSFKQELGGDIETVGGGQGFVNDRELIGVDYDKATAALKERGWTELPKASNDLPGASSWEDGKGNSARVVGDRKAIRFIGKVSA